MATTQPILKFKATVRPLKLHLIKSFTNLKKSRRLLSAYTQALLQVQVKIKGRLDRGVKDGIGTRIVRDAITVEVLGFRGNQLFGGIGNIRLLDTKTNVVLIGNMKSPKERRHQQGISPSGDPYSLWRIFEQGTSEHNAFAADFFSVPSGNAAFVQGPPDRGPWMVFHWQGDFISGIFWMKRVVGRSGRRAVHYFLTAQGNIRRDDQDIIRKQLQVALVTEYNRLFQR